MPYTDFHPLCSMSLSIPCSKAWHQGNKRSSRREVDCAALASSTCPGSPKRGTLFSSCDETKFVPPSMKHLHWDWDQMILEIIKWIKWIKWVKWQWVSCQCRTSYSAILFAFPLAFSTTVDQDQPLVPAPRVDMVVLEQGTPVNRLWLSGHHRAGWCHCSRFQSLTTNSAINPPCKFSKDKSSLTTLHLWKSRSCCCEYGNTFYTEKLTSLDI